MRLSRLLPALLLFLGWPATVNAVDLKKIERTIAKEPAYQGKPQYCLLVFGPEAKTRVWVAVDKDVMYVDRNGNGDLTEEDEKVESRVRKWQSGDFVHQENVFTSPDITDVDGKTKYRKLEVRCHLSIKDVRGKEFKIKTPNAHQISVLIDPWFKQYAFRYGASGKREQLEFAERPQDAPIVHFNGPLQHVFYGRNVAAKEKQDNWFRLMSLTPGIGKGSYAFVLFEDEDIEGGEDPMEKARRYFALWKDKGMRLVAEVEFPGKTPDAPPIKMEIDFEGELGAPN